MARFVFQLLCAVIVMPALAYAGDAITVQDPYARVAHKTAKSGAAFMVLHNSGAHDDRLIAATADIAQKVELHTHEMSDDGVMRMMHVPNGILIPAGQAHVLKRGGDHVMLMGLSQGLDPGTRINLTLVFENAGEIEVMLPVNHNK